MRLLITLLSACAVLYQGTGSAIVGRIFGGEEAKLGDVPWQVVFRYMHYLRNPDKCGGSIINNQWILTAGHCVLDFYSVDDISVGVGLIDYMEMGKKENQRTINNVFIHPNREGSLNDIALVKLNEKIEFNKHVQPIKLPYRNANFAAHICIASGYGENDKYERNKLLKVTLKIESDYTCKKSWGKWYDLRTNLCAGNTHDGKSVCKGDSGGPLACEVDSTYYLAGVTSFGGYSCPGIVPDVYSRVPFYIDWIDNTIKENS